MGKREGPVQKAILVWLELQFDLVSMRFNNVGVWDPVRKAFRRTPFGTRGGAPDIVGWLRDSGRIFWIEVKAPKVLRSPKGKMSDDQLEFEKVCKKMNAYHSVCYSLPDAMSFIDKIRRENRGNINQSKRRETSGPKPNYNDQAPSKL